MYSAESALRDRSSEDRETLGTVLSVGGARASVLLAKMSDGRPGATVGKFLGIRTERSVLIGVVTSVSSPPPSGLASSPSPITGDLDLLGEIKIEDGGRRRFQRGVTEYPVIGSAVMPITQDELRLIYDITGRETIEIGTLQQDAGIPAYINVDDMLHKHFAVFGTTGVGKSSAVAVIINEVLNARPDMRIFLIDPHNEYGHCFSPRAQVLNPRNLRLPFWLFNFEETIDVFFRGRPGVEEEVEILSEVIPQAKTMFAANRSSAEGASLRKIDPKSKGYTVDTPVPYMLPDLVGLIRERMGKLENRSLWSKYHKLISRIESTCNDPRYGFMFDNANVGGDTMVECLSELFRLPANGKPMTIMQLAGFPAEVVDSVVSVLCRMAFDFGLWSDGAVPLLFVCEEAHRYAPADRTIGFGPTRKAVSRIAKEGRKYGVFLGLVTQRPAELDTTIVSQCSTLFAMRMANDRDQAIVKAAVSDAAASLLNFVPSLGTREVFAFGEGVALPTRLRFKQLAAHMIPRSESSSRAHSRSAQSVDRDFVSSVIDRWRGAMMSQRLRGETDDEDIASMIADEFSTVPKSLAGEYSPTEQRSPRRPNPFATSPNAFDQPFPVTSPSAVASPSVAPAPPSPAPTQAFSPELQELRRRLQGR